MKLIRSSREEEAVIDEFQISDDRGETWRAATKSEYVNHERRAGFRNTHGQPDEPGTASFSNGRLAGRMVQVTGIIHCSAAKAIIQDSAGRVLLLREASTNPDGTNPGRWGVPGGRLEPGESAVQALLREVAEETGLAVVVGAKVYRGSWHPTPVCTITGSFFACAAPDGQGVELSDEHDRYCWADRDMLERLDVMEPDRTAVVNVLAGHVEMSVEDQPRNELRDVRNVPVPHPGVEAGCQREDRRRTVTKRSTAGIELRKLGTHQWAGVVMGTIIELGEPRARVVGGGPGFVKVYGWTKELVTERGNVPMSELVSIHSFEWTARRAMRRWLREQTEVRSSSSSIPPLTKLGRSS